MVKKKTKIKKQKLKLVLLATIHVMSQDQWY